MIEQYNTQQEPIILKEYGRNIQKIANHITELEDGPEKVKMAYTLVELMKQINPNIQENQDVAQRIWSHLFIISDMKLDLPDVPYDKPEVESLTRKPDPVPYSTGRISFKHYGKNIDLLIAEIKAMEPGEGRTAATIYLGKLMKRFYIAWNKENVDDSVIIKHIEELSKGELKLDEDYVKENNLFFINFNKIQGNTSPSQQSHGSGSRNTNKRGGGGKRNNNNSRGRR